jgi:hypothetical protein
VIARTPLGFNWGNATKVYVNHWDQRSVTAKDPSRPFRVARMDRVNLVRVFVGTSDVIARWKSDPQGTLADLRRMLDHAHGQGVRLVLSARLDQDAITALGGRGYASWAEAQQDLVTEGSAPWNGYVAWVRAVVGALGRHASAWSWEATNEPQWMLGSDAGAIGLDDLARFLNAMQRELKAAGAQRVNMGGATLEELSDPQLLLATEFTDVLDAHFYPDTDESGAPVGSNAAALIDAFEQHVARVRGLSGRARAAMVGEIGTLPAPWFNAVTQGCKARGWQALAWEFDGWDLYWFNDAHHADVLARLATLNARQ